MTCLVLIAALALFAAAQPGLADQAIPGKDWILIEVDGGKPGYAASLSLAQPGKITGQAPCNSYFGSIMQTGDSFVVGGLAATRMACPDLAAEAAYLQMLQAVSHGVVQDGLLILTGNGHEMRFIQPIT